MTACLSKEVCLVFMSWFEFVKMKSTRKLAGLLFARKTTLKAANIERCWRENTICCQTCQKRVAILDNFCCASTIRIANIFYYPNSSETSPQILPYCAQLH